MGKHTYTHKHYSRTVNVEINKFWFIDFENPRQRGSLFCFKKLRSAIFCRSIWQELIANCHRQADLLFPSLQPVPSTTPKQLETTREIHHHADLWWCFLPWLDFRLSVLGLSSQLLSRFPRPREMLQRAAKSISLTGLLSLSLSLSLSLFQCFTILPSSCHQCLRFAMLVALTLFI